ncbi:MAG TPA: hypothetical protein VF526_06045, partial [Solirubrobacteraceae bacterium]
MSTFRAPRSTTLLLASRGARQRGDRTPERSPRAAGAARRAALAVVACALLAFFGSAAPAPAQVSGLPVQLMVIIVPPNNSPGPRPTGSVIVSLDNRQLLSIPLIPGLKPLTSITPQVTIALTLLGHRVKIRYSGDSNYEASTGIVLTVPTRNLLSITARPRDSAAPAIEVISPRDGARYARGEEVLANYSCRDPDDRSTVTRCEGSVASGSRIDTGADGTFSFLVKTEDALGNAASKTVTYEIGAPAGAPSGRTGGSSG